MDVQHDLDGFGPALPGVVLPLPEAAAPRDCAFHDVHVSCVLPCLNEARNLRELLPLLRTRLDTLCRSWEIIVVDDGSTDETPELMARWSQVPGFRYLQLSRNFGKEAALSAGLEAADGDVVISMDADLQHSPDLIDRMLARWGAGADMVYAVRSHRDDEPALKRMGSRLFYRLLSSHGRVNVPAHAGDFRLMDRRVVDALIALPERTRFMKGLYAWVGFKAEPLPYVPADRAHGSSHFRPLQLGRLALDGLTAFTTWPLRMASLVGGLFAALSFAYGCYVVGEYLVKGNIVAGWTTIVAALLFFAGLNLISLGIVGEYVARIFDEVKGRPLYVVRSRRGTGTRSRRAGMR